MTNNTQNELLDQCRHIAKQIETGEWDFEPNDDQEFPSAFDYLQDALDIEYIVNNKREYLGARVLVAFGGPNIWINTRTQTVDGAWWGDSARVSYSRDQIGLDEALEELWNC